MKPDVNAGDFEFLCFAVNIALLVMMDVIFC